jgi:hypothetical protein
MLQHSKSTHNGDEANQRSSHQNKKIKANDEENKVVLKSTIKTWYQNAQEQIKRRELLKKVPIVGRFIITHYPHYSTEKHCEMMQSFIDENWTEQHDFHFLRTVLSFYGERSMFDYYLRKHMSERFRSEEEVKDKSKIDYPDYFPLKMSEVMSLNNYGQLYCYIEDEDHKRYLHEQSLKYNDYREFSNENYQYIKCDLVPLWYLHIQAWEKEESKINNIPYVSYLEHIRTGHSQTNPRLNIETFFSCVFENEKLFPGFAKNYKTSYLKYKQNQ